jgi:heterodisulfide reductase subunit A
MPGLGVAATSLTAPQALKTGVVVLATGHASYTPRQGEYGFGEGPEVVTLPEFVRTLAEQDGARGQRLAYGGRSIRRLALIHCVGSRQIPGIHQEDEHGRLNEHCSRVCCAASINAANTVRERFPQTAVYELYRDIRTYGRGQEELYAKASANGVVFLRFADEDSPVVARAAQGSEFPLQVSVRDQLTLGEELQVPVDLVVLATGMEPAPIPGLTEMLKLPVGADRFLQEVHPKLRPVELPMSGLFLAGTCQAPMDIGESCNAASAAAVKASALLSKGFVELDPFVAEVNADDCTGCGECVAACLSEGALALAEVDGRAIARVTPALCLGCGACVAVCPQNAINVNGATLAQYEAMVDRILDDTACAD